MREEINNILENSSEKTILVIGDTILDKSTYSKALGLSLESPTLKAKFLKETINIGGAANVVRSIKTLGAKCWFLTALKNKEARQELMKHEPSGKNINLLNAVETNIPTDNIKHRFYVQNGNENYKHFQLNTVNEILLDTKSVASIITELEYCLSIGKKPNTIVFSDYKCGYISDELKKSIIFYGNSNNIPVFVSSQSSNGSSNFHSYIGAQYFVLNNIEFENTFSTSFDSLYGECLNNFLDSIKINGYHHMFWKLKGIFVTSGEKGSKYLDIANRTIIENKGLLVEKPRNIIGAGDSFLAALSLFYDNPELGNEFANIWAGLFVQKEIGELPCLKDLMNT